MRPQQPPTPARIATFAIQLVLGVLLFAGLMYWAGIDASTLALMGDLQWGGLLGAFAFTALLIFFISYRWNLIVNSLAGKKVLSQAESFFYVLLGRTIGFVLPKDFSDMLARAALLTRRNGVSIHISTNSLILDKLLDLIVSIVFLGPSLLFVSGSLGTAQSLGVLTLALVLGFALLTFSGTGIFKLIFRFYNFAVGGLLSLLRRKFQPVDPAPIPSRTISVGYLASIAKQFSIGVRVLFLCQAVGINLTAAPALFGASISQMSYVVAVTPDGLGVFDAAWYAVLLALGTPEQLIALFLIVQRVFTILAIGLMTLAMLLVVPLRRRV
jgi:uncharacterized protein (TIRG00374 family)